MIARKFVIRLSPRSGSWVASVTGKPRVSVPYRIVRHGCRGSGVTDLGRMDAITALCQACPEIAEHGYTVQEARP